jgi:hypothetical protein|tara:strand:- start:1122 stop:1451 length:330 start_codon:yes stop_codon:yes gene_type:complete
MTYQLVQGDQAPQIKAVLKRHDDNSVIDFNNGSCALKFRAKGTTTTLFTLAAADVGDNFQDGIAIFSFSGTQLNVDEGYYEGEIEVTYSSGSVETVYQILDFYVRADFA